MGWLLNVSGLLGSVFPRSRSSSGRWRYLAGSSWAILRVGGIVVRSPISGNQKRWDKRSRCWMWVSSDRGGGRIDLDTG